MNNMIRSYANLSRLFATEAQATTAPNPNGKFSKKAFSLLDRLTKTEEDNLNVLISKHCAAEAVDPTFMGEAVALKHINYTTNKKFEDLTKKMMGPTGRQFLAYLPQATQKILNELSTRKQNLLNKASSTEDATAKFGYAFESEQIDNTMQQIIFGTLTTQNECNLANRRAFGALYSTETMQTYAATVFYPVFEGTLVWFNCAGTTYTKLIPIKQVMNDVTQPVVHTMTYMLQKIDTKTNAVIKEVERSEFYRSYNDPKYADFREFMERKVTFKKSEFKKQINLKTDTLETTGKPALDPLENIKSDFAIVGHKINGSDDDQGPIEIRTDFTIPGTQAVNELYYNGQSFYYYPNKEEKEKFYICSINYESNRCELLLSFDKSAGGQDLPDIEEVTFNFKLHDVNFVNKNDTRWQIYERPSFIPTPTVSRKEINHNMNEFNLMSTRNDADQLSRLMGLANEQISQEKENLFKENIDSLYSRLSDELKVAKKTSTENQVLYIESVLDLATKDDMNRLEGLGLRIGGELNAFVRNYDSRAYTRISTSLSMLTHNTSIGIIAPATKAISGEVTVDSNGGFLGVDVATRTQVITIGTDQAAPVSGVIVGTDKSDLAAKKYDAHGQQKAKGDIEYEFLIFPRFQEANLATNLMIETPTRVISDPNYKSETNRNIPATFVEYATQFYSLRNAGGKMTIKGSMVSGIL